MGSPASKLAVLGTFVLSSPRTAHSCAHYQRGLFGFHGRSNTAAAASTWHPLRDTSQEESENYCTWHGNTTWRGWRGSQQPQWALKLPARLMLRMLTLISKNSKTIITLPFGNSRIPERGRPANRDCTPQELFAQEWDFKGGRDGSQRFLSLPPTWPLARLMFPIRNLKKQMETLLQAYCFETAVTCG